MLGVVVTTLHLPPNEQATSVTRYKQEIQSTQKQPQAYTHTLNTVNTRIHRNLTHTDPQRRLSSAEKPALLHFNIHTR
jgi:hypothetical protein